MFYIDSCLSYTLLCDHHIVFLSPTSSKKACLEKTTVVLGDQSNQQTIQVDGAPSEITSYDIYWAVSSIGILGTSNFYDMADLTVKTEGDQAVIVASLKPEETTGERSERRKEPLADTLDRQ